MIEDCEESQDEGLAKRPTNANDGSTKESRKGTIPSERISRQGKGRKDPLRLEKLSLALWTSVNNMA